MRRKSIHLGVANGLENAKVLLDKVLEDKEKFQVIEVMACPGGCIGGGGQPYSTDLDRVRARMQKLYTIDATETLRVAFVTDGDAVIELMQEIAG